MADVQAEIESKYDVPPDLVVPDLARLAGSGGRVDVDVIALSSTYHDTADADLLRYRLTLRRREGDADTGWHLKLPAADGRVEWRWPLGTAHESAADTVPGEAAELLQPFLRGRPVRPAVRLDVVRTRHRLCNAEGRLVAEVAHDDVRADGLAAQVRAPRWHEVEVEQGLAGSADVQDAIGRALIKAGAVPSTSRTKLGRALLGIGNEGIGTPRTSAGAVLLDYIGAQSDAMVAGHFAICRDVEDSVHKTRVASRRLRSTLRTFGDMFDEERAIGLEDELKWYAAVLGEVRDREVLRRRIAAAVADLPEDLVVGPVAVHIDAHLAGEYEAKRTDLLNVLRGERYAGLLDQVTHWRDDPPFTAAAGRPAAALREDVDRMRRKLGKHLDQATDHASTDDDMHRARKTGKRVRYAAEAASSEAKPGLAKEIAALQDVLGEFQDSIVTQELLHRLAADARIRGEDGFTYGVLVAEERRRADEARQRARADS